MSLTVVDVKANQIHVSFEASLLAQLIYFDLSVRNQNVRVLQLDGIKCY